MFWKELAAHRHVEIGRLGRADERRSAEREDLFVVLRRGGRGGVLCELGGQACRLRV